MTCEKKTRARNKLKLRNDLKKLIPVQSSIRKIILSEKGIEEKPSIKCQLPSDTQTIYQSPKSLEASAHRCFFDVKLHDE